MLGFDCETHLIAPQNLAPKVVCASFADRDGSFVLGNGDVTLEPFVQAVLEDERVVGHNVAFDLACVMHTWPHLTALVFRALADGRVHDTILREKLLLLGSTGDLETLYGRPVEYGLAPLAFRRLGVDISASKTGDDIWRLRYHELDGKSAKDYPPDAYEYARKDAALTREIAVDQGFEHHVEALHVRAAFCAYLMTVRGLAVDAAKLAELEAEIDKELAPENIPLVYSSGLVTPATPGRPYKNGKGTTKPQPEKVNKSAVLQPLVRKICEENGRKVRLTDKGLEHERAGLPVDPIKHVATDVETLREIRHLHPAIDEFIYRAERIKLKTDYFPAFKWREPNGCPACAGWGTVEGEFTCELCDGDGKGPALPAQVVHPNYDPLKKTGRLSSRGNRKGKDALYPSIHIQAADPRIREVFKPREGFVYAIGDYNAIDLCALAQTLLDIFGHSVLADQINAGLDPHTFLGAVDAFDEDLSFQAQAVGKTDREVYDLFAATDDPQRPCPCKGRVKHKPGWHQHYRTFAKVFGLGVPGGMGLDTLCSVAAGYGLSLTREDADRKRKRYFQVYPETKAYLRRWVPQQQEIGKETFRYVSPMGMVRAGCNYTEFANGRALQTPAAEGFKQAIWLVTRACYDPTLGDVLLGSYPVVNMHDELVLEVPDDGLAPERAERMAALMVEGMKTVLPDVAVRVEPVLARRWTKKAKTVRNENGRLLVWGDK